MFSTPPLSDNDKNHVVLVLDHFKDDENPEISYIVMPFLRDINNPLLEIVENVIGLCDQLLEGLVFLHEHGVAHRDCAYPNLMMDASALYPLGHHPVNEDSLPDGGREAPVLPRSSAPLKYYCIDFGISVLIPPQVTTKLVLGTLGRDREVPELSQTVPYDPFKVDIYIIGNFLRRELHKKYTGLDFLTPLIESMTQENPSARPDAPAVLQQWQSIRCRLWTYQRVLTLHPRNTHFLLRPLELVKALEGDMGFVSVNQFCTDSTILVR
ncbi:hypothetical protein K474DRAFT_1681671 [Panus rudis PR-1116 ss-1]|nr:hypothetical protein K474DRAFT_1681671 [Panus rudis PR-1116 ss-1]